jgi:hypothetical protein
MNRVVKRRREMQKSGFKEQMVDSGGLASQLSAFFCTTGHSTKLEIGDRTTGWLMLPSY